MRGKAFVIGMVMMGLGVCTATHGISNNLLAQYSFEITDNEQPPSLADATGNYNLTNYGATPATGIGGEGDGAYSFDGDDYLASSDGILASYLKYGFTLMAWFKADVAEYSVENPDGLQPLASVAQVGGVGSLFKIQYALCMVMGEGCERDRTVGVYHGVNRTGVCSNARVSDLGVGKWHHVALVQPAGGNAILYIDGVEEGRNFCEFEYGEGPITIGRLLNSTFFKGAIDEVRLYEGLVSGTEIESYYIASGGNFRPVADAGPDQAISQLNATVTLDGSHASGFSYDPDGDESAENYLTYLWTMVWKPIGSTASLDDITSPTPTFWADKEGSYEVELVVTDASENTSNPDYVVASTGNVAPVADAGDNQTVLVGEPVTLNGINSYDDNGDDLAYSWEVTSKPEGAVATLSNLTSVQTSITPDVAGAYNVALVVNDGLADSDPSTVTVTAIESPTDMSELLEQAIDELNAADKKDDFKNRNMQRVLTKKISVVIRQIDKEEYQEAHDKLEGDILPKVDGCSAGGACDRNDWVTSCDVQQNVEPLIIDVIQQLELLLP